MRSGMWLAAGRYAFRVQSNPAGAGGLTDAPGTPDPEGAITSDEGVLSPTEMSSDNRNADHFRRATRVLLLALSTRLLGGVSLMCSSASLY